MDMDATQLRRKNFRHIADKLGRNVVAKKMGYSDTNYVNQLCTNAGSFGGRTARKAEKALGLETGWLDHPHPEIEDLPTGDGTLSLEEALRIWERLKKIDRGNLRSLEAFLAAMSVSNEPPPD